MNKQIASECNEIFDNLLTIIDWIRWAATQFDKNDLMYGHGADNAWDEASLLILGILKLRPDQYHDTLMCHLTNDEKKTVLNKIKVRIETKKPVAYLINEAWFGGMSFYVDERVLVPRSPIAELINHHLSPWLSSTEHVKSIIDVCTGSGCIACLLAVNFPDAKIDAVDISPQVLEVAQKNVNNHGLEHQVSVIQSDLMQAVESNQYDLIISNPPYVAKDIVQNLPVEYQHEPELGLIAGEDGLKLVIPLLQQAKKTLKPGGLLVMEVGSSQSALENYYPNIQFVWLDFENNAQGVFVLSQKELLKISA